MCVPLSTLECTNVTSPPILKLWGTQGYIWLPYDLTKVIKLFGKTFEPKIYFFFKKILYVIPSALLSFLPDYCHSFQIIVIPSVLVSFLLNIVIPFKLFTELQIQRSVNLETFFAILDFLQKTNELNSVFCLTVL